MATTKVKQSTRTLGTGEVAIGNISGSAAASAGTYLKQDGTWATVASGIEWQAVQTTGFTAVADKGYPCNTTAAAFTVTLPSSASVGDQISIVDYAGTFDTNGVTINPNSLNLKGSATMLLADKERIGLLLTYVDATQGWVVTSASNEGTSALVAAPYSADFLVVAGGGSGGAGYQSGGSGAGGYRASYNSETSGGGGASESSLTFNPGIVYTVTVGAGATAKTTDGPGNDGNLSLISGSDITTISSAAGGGGGSYHTSTAGRSGGSGGGAGRIVSSNAGGTGTANQGYAGGSTGDPYSAPHGGGGGGGASAVGGDCLGSADGGDGGNGVVSTITAASVTRGGGGGGGAYTAGVGSGGSGGGTAGVTGNVSSANATVNTGGGSGGTGELGYNSGSGGSGVVILRMPTANYSTTTTGSPSVATSGSDTILTFNGDGTYTG